MRDRRPWDPHGGVIYPAITVALVGAVLVLQGVAAGVRAFGRWRRG